MRAYQDYSSPPPDITSEKRQELGRKAGIAVNTFKAALRRRWDDNSEWLVSRPLPTAIDTMMQWASQLLPQRNTTENGAQVQESIGDERRCSSRLKELTSEIDKEGQVPWPFIQRIRSVLLTAIPLKGQTNNHSSPLTLC